MKVQPLFVLTGVACLSAGAALVTLSARATAQQSSGAQGQATAADHKNMMKQLGIKTLRSGPSGNETAPNHANYDEGLANPYPSLPDALTLKNGKKVTSADIWW